jgi:hypothetical protein
MDGMLWILALAALCPFVSLATERIAARIPSETKR